jgi:DNA-binding beta-propeller fold protein YncE
MLAILLFGCDGVAKSEADSAGVSGNDYEPPYGDDSASAGSDDSGTPSDTAPPEQEESFLSLLPAATNAYVFVANPDRDTVTRVSVPSLSVITAPVGHLPVSVVTTPDFTMAATFNVGDNTVSVIEADDLDDITNVSVRNNMNRMELSPDGRWALLFNDPHVELDYPPASGGTLSYDEVSLVNLEKRACTPVVVGFQPKDVAFTPDGSLAVLVSDAYLGTIDLSTDVAGEPARFEVSDDLIDPPEAQEIVVSPDGAYAFVRQFGESTLVVIDLETGTRSLLDVGDNPTDLDLTPDGTKAVAVARGSNELWIYDATDPLGVLPDVVAMPATESFGSVIMNPAKSNAILFSNATADSTHYGAWSLVDDSIAVRALVKPIDTIAISPDGGTALVIHTLANGPDLDPDSGFYDKHALTLLDLDTSITNALALAAKPIAYANSDDGSTGFFAMEGVPEIVALDYGKLIAEPMALSSDPVFLGVLPQTNTAWVSQEHDLGRISFYSPPDTIQTLTGFELNSAIETD